MWGGFARGARRARLQAAVRSTKRIAHPQGTDGVAGAPKKEKKYSLQAGLNSSRACL
jgi:hypothetical protein